MGVLFSFCHCVSFHLFLLLVCFLASVCILLPTLCFSCNHCVSFSFVSCLTHFSSLFSSLFRLFYIFLQALSFSCYQQSRLHRNGGYQWQHWEAKDKLQKTKYKSLLHLCTNTIWQRFVLFHALQKNIIVLDSQQATKICITKVSLGAFMSFQMCYSWLLNFVIISQIYSDPPVWMYDCL